MGRTLILLCCLLSAAPWLYAGPPNSYPIVLVHGFIGWGRSDIPSYHYWGGRDSITDMLTEAGHPTRAGVVGPVSSNWDRACELYAYIKGGRVDYGAAHAARFGHARFGRTFSGLFPDWGEAGEHARIHLVGHSQGGQTIRVLTSLLNRGDKAEQQASQGSDLHSLFRGGKPWVHSVTTLASPHDGTTLAIMLADEASSLLSWMLSLANYVNARFVAASYDFKLDQWGIHRREGESDRQYRDRLVVSAIWVQKDISVWDLQPAGAAAINRDHPAVDSVYYFSWATDDTYPDSSRTAYLPRTGMNLALLSSSWAIGRFLQARPDHDMPAFDESWWPNDGVVNTRSMHGPTLSSTDTIDAVTPKQTRPVFRPGIWYFMGTQQGWDHLDIVGLQTTRDYPAFYRKLAGQLAALPVHPKPADIAGTSNP